MAGGLLLDDSINTTDNDRSDFAERLVRPLRFRYAAVFVAVASLLLADQAVIQPLLVRLNGYAPVINMAGRQRMLSQKLAKQSLALEFGVGETSAEARRDELSKTVEQWSTAHHILRDGDPRREIGPITTPRIASELRDLEPDFAAMRAAANQLAAAQEPTRWLGQSLSDAPESQTGASPGRYVLNNGQPFLGQALSHPSPAEVADAQVSGRALVRAILDHETDYLAGMERVVAMLESEARQQVAWLRLCAVAAVVTAIVLLASLYAFVLRPATTLIRQQLRMLVASDSRHRALAELLSRARDELERRVAERTTELSQANSALESEMRQRQRVETRMRRLSSDLAHATRITALGQLATGLAHELNQPLGAIANYAGAFELLLENELADNHASRRAITEVKRSALRAGEIVRRMRNFVRRSADHASLVDLNDLVREVAELCEPELRRRDVKLTLALCGEAPVVADPIQIQQVLVNLVQNAIQAVRDVEGHKVLGIRTSVTAAGAQVDVADSGPGFPDIGRDDPFARFFSTKADGLGMGLAISQTIIEQHQGRISAGNCPDGGAIVSFCLPLAACPKTGVVVEASNLTVIFPVGSQLSA